MWGGSEIVGHKNCLMGVCTSAAGQHTTLSLALCNPTCFSGEGSESAGKFINVGSRVDERWCSISALDLTYVCLGGPYLHITCTVRGT